MADEDVEEEVEEDAPVDEQVDDDLFNVLEAIPVPTTVARGQAAAILDGDEWRKFETTDLARAAAALTLALRAEERSLKARKARLAEAVNTLNQRFLDSKTTGVRVDVEGVPMLGSLTQVYRVSVPVERRAELLEWLRANLPEEIDGTFHKFDSQHYGSLVRRAEEGEGLFPTDLVERGIVQIYRGTTVRFRKAPAKKK